MSILIDEILRCPNCQSKLSERESTTGADSKASSVLSCNCGNEYPVVNGVPRFLGMPEEDVQSTDTLESFNFQYGKEDWIFDYDVVRVKRILKSVFKIGQKEIESKTVCVIGCGNGGEVNVLASFAPKYLVGVDLTDSIEDAAKNNKHYDNVFVLQADALNPPMLTGSFDVLYCDGVMPHTRDPKGFLKGILALVKPGGTAYIRTLVDHGTPQSALHVLPRNFIRKFTKRLPSGLWWNLCYLIGVLVKIPVLGNLLARAFFYHDPKDTSIKVTQLVNFRFYGNHKFRHRLGKQELVDVIESTLPGSKINIEGSMMKIERTPEKVSH